MYCVCCIYVVSVLCVFCICVFQKIGNDVLEIHFRIAFHFAAVSFIISVLFLYFGRVAGGRLEGAWALGPQDPRAPRDFGHLGP